MSGVRIAFLLHLYQPPTQEAEVFKRVVDQCYVPLLKFIKSRKTCKFTLNIPLSTLELLDTNGYTAWIKDVKDLVSQGRVELVGCGAYHPILSRIPPEYAEKEVVLNEYGLGYYFGSHQGFEGESALLVKDVIGFFPPEMAVNTDVLDLIKSFGYSWIIADQTALYDVTEAENPGVYSYQGSEFSVVIRDRALSNLISFKRDLDVSDVENYLDKLEPKDVVIAMDGEVFGHHYDEGIFMLENVIDSATQKGWTLGTVSEVVEDADFTPIQSVADCSWGASDDDMAAGNPLPYWEVKGNELQGKMQELQQLLLNGINLSSDNKSPDGFETLPVWSPDELAKLGGNGLEKDVMLNLLVCKALHSDQFWWTSKGTVMGRDLFDIGMITRALDLYRLIGDTYGDASLKESIDTLSTEIKNLL